ncbi:KH domain-containing protein [Dorcoceras hygrometricum]|uniref:KH domain-containing protein n=1 Tax=Dorcoceras hygrometricum TaxID=472368 RepID=A0A2Z7BIM4_9LAMI|nr:KH domain-containing protein [Dorcoceras hygrometricum]
METGGVKRRGEVEAGLNGNGDFKKSKRDHKIMINAHIAKVAHYIKMRRHGMHFTRGDEDFITVLQQKCNPFELLASRHVPKNALTLSVFCPVDYFSTSGCSFGDGCHFLHYVPGGIKGVTRILGSNPALPVTRNAAGPPSFPDTLSRPALKTRLCTKFNTAEGCKFGDKCHYAHGECELGRPAHSSHEELHAMGQMPGKYSSGHLDQNEPDLFGASATAKISIDASLVGAVIGRGGMNSKQICRVTGAKLAIRDHESDPNSKNIELEGSFDQIKHASQMVRELIVNVSSGLGRPTKNRAMAGSGPGSNFKTKLCDNFTNGSCSFGEKCNFAHGEEELRKLPM